MKPENANVRQLLPDAAAAADMLRPGDRVCFSMMESVPLAFLNALADCRNLAGRVTLYIGSMPQSEKLFKAGHIIEDYFYGPSERALAAKGAPISYVPVHLSDITPGIRCDSPVVVLQTPPPDERGMFSTGPLPYEPEVLRKARAIILQLNERLPFVYGEGRLIPPQMVTAVYYHNEEPLLLPSNVRKDEDRMIAELIAERIPNGACIQLGIGGVGDAVGQFLRERHDLGIHSELFTDSMVDLIKCGAVNNSQKRYMKGKTVFAAAMVGSKRLYELLDGDPNFEGGAFSRVNDARIIALNDNVASVNCALQADLFGQVCAESLGPTQYSGTGGQADFVRGARWSKGGMSFIALPSARLDRGGELVSRLSLALPVGSAVTTPRADVQYVVTEYGAANLLGLSTDARARALIGIAHPRFRDELTFQAKSAGLLL